MTTRHKPAPLMLARFPGLPLPAHPATFNGLRAPLYELRGRLLPKMRRQERDLRARDPACDKVEFDGADTMTIPSPRFIPFPLTGLATLVAPAKCQWPPAGSIEPEVIEPQPPRASRHGRRGWFLPPRYMAGGVSPSAHLATGQVGTLHHMARARSALPGCAAHLAHRRSAVASSSAHAR